MLVQVNTDNHIDGHESLARYVESALREGVGHHAEQLTRLEVHLKDANADKGGDLDKHCTIEARPEGRPPLAVTGKADNLHVAIDDATDKLRSALDTLYGRMRAQ